MQKIHKDSFDGYLRFKKTKKFYKLSGREKHLKNVKKNKKIFKKLILNKKNQEFRNCQVCKSKLNEVLFIKDGYKHVRCKKCKFVFVNPILKTEVQEKALKKESSYTRVMKNKINVMLDNNRFKYGLQNLSIKKKDKKILDYGTGYGLFLDNAKKFKWKCYANEINTDCIKVLRKKKIIIDKKFQKNFYDAITLWLVFEHVPYPNALLKKIYKSLKKGGKLLVNVPNVNSLSALILKEKCTMFSGHQHVNHFSKNSLEKILKKNNFKIEKTETIISDAGTTINYLNYNDPYLGKSNGDFEFTKPSFIHKNYLGYTLLTIAKK